MPIAVTVNPDFLNRCRMLQAELKPILTEAMDSVMQEVERIARSTADWNPDGTVVESGGREYVVTGGARQSITAYAVGAERDPQHNFQLEDPLTGHVHESVSLEPIPDDPLLVQGIVTMAEDHSAYLQEYEMRGPSENSPSLFGGGRTITTEVLHQQEEFIVSALAQEADVLLKAI